MLHVYVCIYIYVCIRVSVGWNGLYSFFLAPHSHAHCNTYPPFGGSRGACYLWAYARADPSLDVAHTKFLGVGLQRDMYHNTQRLQCSSFLVMTYFLLQGLQYTAQKGTTLEPLGKYDIREKGYCVQILHLLHCWRPGTCFPPSWLREVNRFLHAGVKDAGKSSRTSPQNPVILNTLAESLYLSAFPALQVLQRHRH